MIITDEDESIRKQPPQQQQATALGASGQGSTAVTASNPPFSPTDTTITSIPPSSVGQTFHDTEEGPSDDPPPYETATLLWREKDVKRRTWQRFLRAFAVAFLIYVAVGIIIGTWSKTDDTSSNEPGNRQPDRRPSCVSTTSSQWDWDRSGKTANTTLQLSNNVEALKVLSNKPSSGSIAFRDDLREDQTVHVQISAYSTRKRKLQGAEACLSELNRGATIDLRSNSDIADDVQFSLVVSFPTPKDSSGRHRFKHVETHLPLYSHTVHTMQALHFQNVELYSEHQPIQVESLNAHTATISTSNAPIAGYFNISNSVTLSTSNAAIKPHVTLRSDGKNTTLSMSTHNAEIEADINLLSSLPSGYGGSFAIESKTINKGSMINVHSAPLDSLLLLDASTTIGHITTDLPSTYEGSYDASVTAGAGGQVNVLFHDYPDPAGQKRSRERVQKTTGSGKVYWRPRRKMASDGRVNVRTTIGKATLVF